MRGTNQSEFEGRNNMDLIRISLEDAEKLWNMQREAFQDLYIKYQDTATSPATEKIDKIIMRLKQSFTYYYFINVDGIDVGAIRVVDKQEENIRKRISPIFIVKKYRGNGYAQTAIKLVEELHGDKEWELDTILQEKGNCYLYEKLGYYRTGKIEKLNDKLTLVCYKKD